MNKDTATKQLIEKKNELGRQLSGLDSADPSEDTFRTIDNNPEDESDESVRGNQSEAMRRIIEAQLQDIAIALKKIENNSYGICDKCGIDIREERLNVVPEATYCISCESELDTNIN